MSSAAASVLGRTESGRSAARTPLAAWLRLHLTYLWRHDRLLDLANPVLFTEIVQRRKLLDRNPALPILADKVRVKRIVADRIGPEWVIPTLWHGDALPEASLWPAPFVVKARHGCNQTAFVRDGSENWQAIRKQSRRWMSKTYGFWLDEWVYRDIPRGILIEPFVGRGGALPVDYKLYVFHGRVEFIQIHLEREHAHRWIILDRNWWRVTSPTHDADPAPPVSLPAMIAAAEELAHGLDFVRADFYEVDTKPLFGELTFYPGSGLDPFDPVSLDAKMGALWLKPERSVDHAHALPAKDHAVAI